MNKDTIKRRDFLTASLAGVGGLIIGSQSSCNLQKKARFHDPYEKVRLGKTDIKLSRLCMGTGVKGWQRQSNQTRMGEDDFEALVRQAYDRGINAYDLADLYGTHPYILDALSGIDRSKFVIMTKIWWRGGGLPEKERPEPNVIVQRFLKELRTDYIDLLLLHCVESPDWPTELSSQMQQLAVMKEKGIIRAHGVSCHSLDALKAAVNEKWVDSVHTRINPYGIKMDGPAEKVAPVLQDLHSAGKGVVGMKLIGEGAFRDSDEKRNHSVRYALQLGCVDVMNVGFEKLEEIDDFAARDRSVPRGNGIS